jgi:hypothetical protein
MYALICIHTLVAYTCAYIICIDMHVTYVCSYHMHGYICSLHVVFEITGDFVILHLCVCMYAYERGIDIFVCESENENILLPCLCEREMAINVCVLGREGVCARVSESKRQRERERERERENHVYNIRERERERNRSCMYVRHACIYRES